MPRVESREQKSILENSLSNKEKEPNNSTEQAEILLEKRELLSTLFGKSRRLHWELDCPDRLKNDIEISISFFSTKLAQPQIQERVTASASPEDAVLYDRISKALNSTARGHAAKPLMVYP